MGLIQGLLFGKFFDTYVLVTKANMDYLAKPFNCSVNEV